MNIRKANIRDERDILEIHQEAIESGCVNDYSERQIASWAAPQGLPPFKEQLKSSLFLIAEEGGQCIGFGCIKRDKTEIEALFVKPDYFGRGVGSKLLSCLEQTVNSVGSIEICVDSTINAAPFYKKQGYQFLCDVVHVEPDGTEVQCLKMVKTIN